MALGKYSCNHNMSESKTLVYLLQHFQGLLMFLAVFYFLPFTLIKLVEHGNIQEHHLRMMSNCYL